jgi:hypothetical protein
MAVLSFAAIVTSFAGRYPNPGGSNTLESLEASGAKKPAEPALTLEAAATRGFASFGGKLLWVKAESHFGVAGETVIAGELVQLPEVDAKRLIANGQATFATDADVAAAQKAK